MNFLQWFNRYARWSTIGWLAIIGLGTYWEIAGFIRKDGTTFTDLVRSTVPVWARVIILGALAWHFCLAKANY